MDTVKTLPEEEGRFRSACVSCHRRKVRCVRVGDSCTNCLQSDIPCRYSFSPSTTVEPAQKPGELSQRKRRGPYKKGKTPREKELEDVVKSLTEQCQSLKQRLGSSDGSCSTSPQDFKAGTTDSPLPLDTGNVESQHIRPVSSLTSIPSSVRQRRVSQLGEVPCDNTQYSLPRQTSLPQSVRDHVLKLYPIYRVRVDPLVKLIPYSCSADQLLLACDTHASSPDVQLLMLSVCVAAVVSLTEAEVAQLFQDTKDGVVAAFASGIEAILTQPDILQVLNSYLLQALVLHAFCLYRYDSSNAVSSSEALQLALHVTHLMDIRGQANQKSALDGEIRRRCWWTLCKLCYLQKPRSSAVASMLATEMPLPLNVNDVDLSPVTNELPAPRKGLTETSFFLNHLEVVRLTTTVAQYDMATISAEVDSSTGSEVKDLVYDCVRRIEKAFLWHCDASRPLDWFMMLTAKAMLNPIEITMFQRDLFDTGAFGAMPTDAKADRLFLLRLDVVECWHLLTTNENLKPWRWFLKTLPQAFTVADLQAELALHSESTYSDRARALIDLVART